ncbi:50S ribosomal protein L31e [Aeropyrum pernix]|uniref:Large ribosomal subunit protein eL31 n=1 Tax=Aeropyrum pernix TaxID=56636 RepID=A0A401HAG7_AERPX|nr:50S ribosomal protein L31e [Aeropyrum pernix]
MVPSEGTWVYVVNLRRVYWGRRTRRAIRAVRMVREFVKRHTKADEVVIDNELNNYIWSRSREKPPARVKIIVSIREEEPEEGGERIRKAVVRLAGRKLRPGRYKG